MPLALRLLCSSSLSDGAVTKFEFCVGLRKLLEHGKGNGKGSTGGQKEREEIDNLFDSLDLDRAPACLLHAPL